MTHHTSRLWSMLWSWVPVCVMPVCLSLCLSLYLCLGFLCLCVSIHVYLCVAVCFCVYICAISSICVCASNLWVPVCIMPFPCLTLLLRLASRATVSTVNPHCQERFLVSWRWTVQPQPPNLPLGDFSSHSDSHVKIPGRSRCSYIALKLLIPQVCHSGRGQFGSTASVKFLHYHQTNRFFHLHQTR